VVAECNLASLYFRQRDLPQALRWFLAAAQSGNPTAQEDLAWMYYTGTGTARDYAEAAKWVRLAAEQSVPRAELDLAYLYEQGKGCLSIYVASYEWYRAASTGGKKRANGRLQDLTRIMTPEQISNARVAAAQTKTSHPTIPLKRQSQSQALSPIHGNDTNNIIPAVSSQRSRRSSENGLQVRDADFLPRRKRQLCGPPGQNSDVRR
jgi:TPR repeat protein